MPKHTPSQSFRRRFAGGARETVLVLFCCLVASAGWAAQDPTETQADRAEADKAEERRAPAPKEYIELFDPDREDPEDVDDTEPPIVDIDEPIDRAVDTADDRPAWWKPEPPPIPERILAPGDTRDPRSVELFYYSCADRDQRRDITLFANGTLRQRRGPWDDQELQLEEMGQAELRRHVDRLMRIRADADFPRQFDVDSGVSGAWVDRCTFELDLPGMELTHLEVTGLDALPLPLQQLVGFAEDLAAFTRPLALPENLPKDYRPERGVVLRTRYGSVYRVLGYTSDGGAVELERLDGATTIFVPVDDLSDFFVAIEPDFRS